MRASMNEENKYDELVNKCNKMSYLIGFLYSVLRETQFKNNCDNLDEILAIVEPMMEEVFYNRTQSAAVNG